MNTLTPEVIAWLQALSTLFALVALILSALAVYFTVLSFRLKKGAFVRGQYQVVSSSVNTNDPYVSEVLLENLKDRSIVIFGIYLYLDHGYYLCLEEFEQDPLIISPFEVVKRSYDPLDSYSFSMKRFKIDHLFESRSQKKLMLSTTDGMIAVKKPIFINKPFYQWFKNHFIVEIRADRMTYRGRSYGSGTKFLVNLCKDSEVVQTIQLYGRDHQYKWFRDLGGEESDLVSADAVEQFFGRVILDGKFNANRVEVVDYQAELKKRYEDYRDLESSVIKRRSWFVVYIVGYLLTSWRANRLRHENRSRGRKPVKKNGPPKFEEDSAVNAKNEQE